jgi:hypothetical protein
MGHGPHGVMRCAGALFLEMAEESEIRYISFAISIGLKDYHF